MRHHLYFTLLYVSMGILPSSCNKVLNYIKDFVKTNNSEVNIVKAYKPYRVTGVDLTLEEAFTRLIGVKGEISWKSFKPKDFVDRPEIIMVQIDMKTNRSDSKPEKLLIQYLVNKNSKSVEFYAAEKNGKPIEKVMVDLSIIGTQFPL
ncbi:hypothetical protein [Spirosoma spitsbergense]|uniref:hypothetical protein n=1 Tax=Spirosoma spitsbergense TaxID=431554 RepID=UPI000379C898|nr:hypothetical protein [Spirosoma spitsbergense]